MIRVLRIQSRICVGGPALHTIMLAAHLGKPFQSKLVGGRLEPGEVPQTKLAKSENVQIETIEEMGRSLHWWDDIKALWRMIKFIRQYKPHIVHTHTAKAGAVGRVAAFLCRVPIRLHTFHGHVFHGYFSQRGNQAVRWVERILAKMSSRILVISQRQYDDIVTHYRIVPAKKCRIVPLGFDLSKLKSSAPGKFKARLGLDPSVRLIGFLARLVPVKNHELFIRSVALWQKQNPDVSSIQFLILGDGEEREKLEKLSHQLGCNACIRFTGWQDDIHEIYADLDLNVLCSHNEGTPVTLIEGLAAGVPFLSTDVGGIRDIYEGPHGHIVPADATPEVFAAALQKLLDKPSNRLPQTECEDIVTRFSIQRLCADIRREYFELLDSKRIDYDRPKSSE